MKNLKEVVDKIKKAERIVLYSDSDLDGVTSALILKKTIEYLGKEAKVFFTDKEKRGYGLNVASVEMIKDEAPALLLVTDCGVSNFEGVEKANKLGFEVVIMDHHKPHDKLPEADLIVCPKLHDDAFKERPNAGITLLLSEIVFGERRKELVEYNALAVLADMMPHKEDNAEIIKMAKDNFPVSEGMKSFSDLWQSEDFFQVAQRAVPVLNITDMIDGVPESFIFFNTEEEGLRKKIAEKLISDYKKRKESVENIKKEALKEDEGREILFTGSSLWPSYLLGKVASKLVSELDKPIFLFKDKGDISQGTVRVPEGEDAVEAMKRSKDILITYGGHPPAAGFAIENRYRDQFKENLLNYFKK